MSLLDKASLIITPNAYKESKLYSVIPSNGDGDMTVVRATTATRVNEQGLIEVVPKNLVTYSEQFDNAAWIKERSLIGTNSTIAPNGSLTADKLIEDSTDNSHRVRQNLASIQGNSYILSFYAKASERTKCRVIAGGLGASANFDLTNGLVIGTPTLCAATITSFNNGWYNCAINYTQTSATDLAQLHLISTLDASENFSYQGDGTSGIYIWGAQLEAGSTATSYFPTTDRLNIPRIDYTGGGCPSILVETQRTNLALYSEQFDNASWGKINAIITANVTTAPDGTTSADKLVEDTSTGGHSTQSVILVSNSTIYTTSVFVKYAGREWIRFTDAQSSNRIHFNTLTGVFGTISGTVIDYNKTALENGWYKLSFTTTSVATAYTPRIELAEADNDVSYTGDGVSGVFIWGAQLEAGSYPTSYIPTVGSTVTRNADVISKTGISDLIGQTEGTLYAEVDLSVQSEAGLFRRILMISNGAETDSTYLRVTSGNIVQFVSFDGTVQTLINSISSISGNVKIAATYKTNEFRLYINGVLQGTDLLGSIPATRSILRIGNSDALVSTHNLNDRIKSVQLYKEALTDEQLIALTTI